MTEMICYCHNYTAEDLEKDALVHGKSLLMEQIIQASRAGNCNCKENNPKKR